MLLVSGNGATSIAQWAQVGSFGGVAVTSIVVNDARIFAGTGGNGVFASSNNGTTWTPGGLSGYSITSLAATDSFLFAGTNSIPGDIFRSSDSGKTWAPSGLTDIYFQSFMVNGSTIFAGTMFTQTGVYRTTDDGRIWIRVNADSIYDIRALTIKDANLLFAGTADGVFLSTNNGRNWIGANTGLTSPSINTLAVKDSFLFAGTIEGGVFVSTNNGASWSPANNGLTVPWVTAFAQSGSCIFAATQAGIWDPGEVYLSTDNGSRWSSTNLWVREVWALAVCGPYLFAGGGIGGVYRRSVAEMITAIEAPRSQIPDHPALGQNYPNPFNPTTTLNYALPMESRVRLTILNVLGQIVETLVDGVQQAGYSSVQWNAGSVASDIYFYRLEATSLSDPGRTFTSVKKMVVMK